MKLTLVLHYETICESHKGLFQRAHIIYKVFTGIFPTGVPKVELNYPLNHENILESPYDFHWPAKRWEEIRNRYIWEYCPLIIKRKRKTLCCIHVSMYTLVFLFSFSSISCWKKVGKYMSLTLNIRLRKALLRFRLSLPGCDFSILILIWIRIIGPFSSFS